MTKYVTGAQVRGNVSSRSKEPQPLKCIAAVVLLYIYMNYVVKLNLDLRLYCDLIKEGRSPFPPNKNDHKRPVYN